MKRERQNQHSESGAVVQRPRGDGRQSFSKKEHLVLGAQLRCGSVYLSPVKRARSFASWEYRTENEGASARESHKRREQSSPEAGENANNKRVCVEGRN